VLTDLPVHAETLPRRSSSVKTKVDSRERRVARIRLREGIVGVLCLELLGMGTEMGTDHSRAGRGEEGDTYLALRIRILQGLVLVHEENLEVIEVGSRAKDKDKGRGRDRDRDNRGRGTRVGRRAEKEVSSHSSSRSRMGMRTETRTGMETEMGRSQCRLI